MPYWLGRGMLWDGQGWDLGFSRPMEGSRWLSGLTDWQVPVVVSTNELILLTVSSQLPTPVVLKPPWLSTLVNCKLFKKGAVKFCVNFFFFKIFIYLRERGREGEREGDEHWSVACHTPPIGDLGWNPSMCPDWESNQRRFSFQAGAQPTEQQQPGLCKLFTARGYSHCLVMCK